MFASVRVVLKHYRLLMEQNIIKKFGNRNSTMPIVLICAGSPHSTSETVMKVLSALCYSY